MSVIGSVSKRLLRALRAAPLATALIALVAVAGCSPHELDTDEDVAEAAAPIINGQSTSNPAVPYLRWAHNGLEGGCSAMAIGPHFVVTATHCVIAAAGCETSGNSLVPAESIYLVASFPDWLAGAEPIARGAKLGLYTFADVSFCEQDMVVLRLDRDLPVQETPIRFPDAPMQAGERATIFGWGATETNLEGNKVKQVRPSELQAREAEVVTVGPGVYTPTGEGFIPIPVPQGTFLTTEAACFGDSGGPILSESGTLIGVTSKVTHSDPKKNQTEIIDDWCVGGFTKGIRPPFALLERAYADDGKIPWREGRPQPSALRGTCEDSRDCHTKLCIEWQNERLCSVSCKDAACPAGFRCAAEGEDKICIPDEPAPDNSICAFVPPTSPSHRDSGLALASLIAAALARALRRRPGARHG